MSTRTPEQRAAPMQVLMMSELWEAVGLAPDLFHSFCEEHGYANTYGLLLEHVQKLSGTWRACPESGCVLREHNSTFPHYEAQDVGANEPLPFE